MNVHYFQTRSSFSLTNHFNFQPLFAVCSLVILDSNTLFTTKIMYTSCSLLFSILLHRKESSLADIFVFQYYNPASGQELCEYSKQFLSSLYTLYAYATCILYNAFILTPTPPILPQIDPTSIQNSCFISKEH